MIWAMGTVRNVETTAVGGLILPYRVPGGATTWLYNPAGRRFVRFEVQISNEVTPLISAFGYRETKMPSYPADEVSMPDRSTHTCLASTMQNAEHRIQQKVAHYKPLKVMLASTESLRPHQAAQNEQ
jgi:hypothetical protein